MPIFFHSAKISKPSRSTATSASVKPSNNSSDLRTTVSPAFQRHPINLKHKGQIMKPHLHLIALAATAALLGTATARSQQISAQAPRPAQSGQRIENPFTETRSATASVTLNAVAAPQSHTVIARPAAMRGSSQSLLIRTREVDSEAQTQLEEDLKVMSRIVEKATQTESTHGPRAMGIELVLGRGASSVRSLYLDGYGVLFIADVGFPLLPLPAGGQEETSEVKKDEASTWEQTREELYGNPGPPVPVPSMGWFANSTEALAYDSDKVDRLRQDLIEAIKNASNIRQLAPDESITICVQGPSAIPHLQVPVYVPGNVPGTRRSGKQSTFESRLDQVVVRQPEVSGDSTSAVMTLQASKSDIDRFARGEITTKQFRDLARTQVYLSGSWSTPAPLYMNKY
jgi:hypothetical protein